MEKRGCIRFWVAENEVDLVEEYAIKIVGNYTDLLDVDGEWYYIILCGEVDRLREFIRKLRDIERMPINPTIELEEEE